MNNNINKFCIDKKIEFEENISFRLLTTYQTGGVASFVVFPNNTTQLIELLKFINKNNINYKLFGNGSNILASDFNYNGIIIKLTKMNSEKINNNILVIESGCDLANISNKYSKLGYSGLEFACGIPGTIGGAIYMNAGAYLHSISEIVKSVTYLNEKYEIKKINNKNINFSYRDSIFKHKNWIIIGADIILTLGNKKEIIELITDRRLRRISSQPLEYPNAGSVFRNPVDSYAGKLIEDVGLKGKSKGNAQISNKHANFIVNKGNASSKDVKYLIDLAHKKVEEKYHIEMNLEQELFNF